MQDDAVATASWTVLQNIEAAAARLNETIIEYVFGRDVLDPLPPSPAKTSPRAPVSPRIVPVFVSAEQSVPKCRKSCS
jgi:hypothetical protein